jgi:hypothetical protein
MENKKEKYNSFKITTSGSVTGFNVMKTKDYPTIPNGSYLTFWSWLTGKLNVISLIFTDCRTTKKCEIDSTAQSFKKKINYNQFASEIASRLDDDYDHHILGDCYLLLDSDDFIEIDQLKNFKKKI